MQARTTANYGWKHDSGYPAAPKTGDLPVDLMCRLVRPDPKQYVFAFNLFRWNDFSDK